MDQRLKELTKAIEEDKEELFDILSKLIQINSENFRTYGNETACPEFVKACFDRFGCDAEVYSPLDIPNFAQHPDYWPGRNLHGRKNCTAILPGTHHDRKLMLAAHHDTVEIGDAKNWTVPPLGGVIRDGKLFGRGACDDKYGIAVAIFLMKKLKELGITLDYDLLFTAYCDEEHGGSNGALAMCLKYPCDDYWNMDGMEYEISDTGVGGGGLIFHLQSQQTTDNCGQVFAGLQVLVRELEVFGARRRQELSEDCNFANTGLADSAMRLLMVNTDPVNLGSGMAKVTYYTNKTQDSIRQELAQLKENVDNKLESLGLMPLEIEQATRFFHCVEGVENNPMVELLQKCGKENDMPLGRMGICLSDLPMFHLYGSPRSVIFGLGRDFGSYGGAHQPDEYVECDKLVAFTKTIAAALLNY